MCGCGGGNVCRWRRVRHQNSGLLPFGDKGRGGAKGTQQGCYLTVARQHETTNSGLLPFGRTKVGEGPRELNMVAI